MTRADARPAPLAAEPFHRKGVGYFWILNDRFDWPELNRQLEAFAADDNVMSVCLHPRAGMLIPYGGEEWFDAIRRICERCSELDLPVWLYDEDPFPSGNAGGRIVVERPDLIARGIQRYEYDPNMQGDKSIFGIPARGPLIWAGLVGDSGDEHVDLTDRFGMLRRTWHLWEKWDSRFFYADTPRYETPRADTSDSEYAITVPEIPDGMKLVAFTAERAMFNADSCWGDLVDSLNPAATQLYIEMTHERYKRCVGDMFGKQIKAIFTDEPKFFDPNPYTPGMFDDFRETYGYDIRPYLGALFDADDNSDRARRTRLEYRQYVAELFRTNWVKPVGDWCRANDLALVGHISPEDDPIEQAMFVGNIFPLWKEFDLCGTDVIIPAVGDQRHPILSVGSTAANSAAHQYDKQGSMSETGALATNLDHDGIARVLLWQAMLGITAQVMHCAFSSVRGPRAYEYPPNYGPNGALWEGMHDVHRRLAEVHDVTFGATMVAPVAILWPVRTFQMQMIDWQTDPSGLRRAFNTLLAACYDRQVGTHLLDEQVLWDMTIEDGALVIGRARYEHILLPGCRVLHQRTVEKLKQAMDAGIDVRLTGELPRTMQTDAGLDRLDLASWPLTTIPDAAAAMPRLLEIEGDATDIRCTAWGRGGEAPTRLLMNLRPQTAEIRFDGKSMTLEPGVMHKL